MGLFVGYNVRALHQPMVSILQLFEFFSLEELKSDGLRQVR